MDLTRFQQLYERFNKPNLPKKETESADFDAFVDAINHNKECGDWYLARQLEKRGFDYSGYCCLEMATHVAEGRDEKGEEIDEDPNVIIKQWDEDMFGIPVYDGEGTIIIIRYCPWCGTRLAREGA